MAKEDGEKHLDEHKCEWKDEEEMRCALGKCFSKVQTFTFASRKLTTLFWACQK